MRLLSSSGKRSQVQTNEARRTHTWIVGQPGSGKSKLIEAAVLQDVMAGRGVGAIDIHGDLFGDLTYRVALLSQQKPEIANRVVILDPLHAKWTVPFNPLAAVQGLSQERVALFLTDVVMKIWSVNPVSAPRMIWLLTNSFQALSALKLSLLDLPRFLLDAAWREQLVPRLANEQVRSFWAFEFPKSEGAIHQWVTPVLNKLGGLLWDKDIRLMLSGDSILTFRDVIDRQLILLVNLPKGIIGEGSSALIAAFIVAHLQKAALARADTRQRPPFFLYLDEFQNYTTDNILDILSESRKYALSLTLAHQYLDQLSSELRSALLNTTGSIVCFRVGYHDAAQLVKEIFPSPDFLTTTERDAKVRRIGRIPYVAMTAREEPLRWDGLAQLLANLAPREFWYRRRGPYTPVKQHTLTLHDVIRTPELEAGRNMLYELSGHRYGKLKSVLEEQMRARQEPFSSTKQGKTDGPDDIPMSVIDDA